LKEKSNILTQFYYFADKWQIRTILLVIATSIIISIIVFIKFLIEDLIEKEQKLIKVSALIYKDIALSINDEESKTEELFKLLEQVNENISFPLIATNEDNQPNYPYEKNSLNIDFNNNLSQEEKTKYMEALVKDMASTYDPIIVKDNDGNILMKLFYTKSTVVDILEIFPIIVIFSVGGLLLLSYVIFNDIRKNQESMVWVGMSKEAAHQMGTPLSSLLAWIEILKLQENEEVNETVSEMEKDVIRLNIIANRFAKIGSTPKLERVDITELIDNAKIYFQRRLPHLGKKINIKGNYKEKNYKAYLNPELFTWVLENLIKNAAEAIVKPNGEITIDVYRMGSKLEILIKDNGKGMSKKVKKNIFSPGFTTKKRGWGLGLSLSRRIIEQYHKGKIFIKDSQPSIGTTFQIDLPTRIEYYG